MGVAVAGKAVLAAVRWVMQNKKLVFDKTVSALDKAGLIKTVYDYGGVEAVKDAARIRASEEIEKRTGLVIAPDDLLKEKGLADALSEKTGVQIRSLTNGDTLKEDALKAASDEIVERGGPRFTDLSSTGKIKADFAAYGSNVLAQDFGIELSNPESVEQVKADFRDWAMEQGRADFEARKAALKIDGDKMQRVANKAVRDYGRNDKQGAAVGQYEESIGQKIGALREMEQAFADKIVSVLNGGGGAESGSSRSASKREKNRRASQAFRDAHGNRLQYMPVGE